MTNDDFVTLVWYIPDYDALNLDCNGDVCISRITTVLKLAFHAMIAHADTMKFGALQNS